MVFVIGLREKPTKYIAMAISNNYNYSLKSCCIPDSGDGTLRKNPTIWRSWNPALGAGLHRQVFSVYSGTRVINGTSMKYCGLNFG